MSLRRLAVGLAVVACLTPAVAGAQAAPSASQGGGDTAADQSRAWIVIGGTTTTLRGDCQEGCPAHGTGAYLHTGSVLGVAGFRITPQADAGLEVSWVPSSTKDGQDFRATFLLATGQFRPWTSNGFFLRGGMGMVFVRNFVFGESQEEVPAITSKALGLTYGAGWAFWRDKRVGFELFGAQHMAALGDFQAGGVNNENVIANFWSLGAAIVIR
ncbi:MAG TPA: hypothetical protein VIY56_07785 [Vicinamibacterales bacterium]